MDGYITLLFYLFCPIFPEKNLKIVEGITNFRPAEGTDYYNLEVVGSIRATRKKRKHIARKVK